MERLFFAFDIEAPWPEALPKGRLLVADERHMTLAFLGEVDLDPLLEQLEHVPKPSFSMGFSGYFDEILFLPSKHPRVVAWHGNLGDNYPIIADYQKVFAAWLRKTGFPPTGEHREWLPHVTLCRSPFNEKQWKKIFCPTPFISSKIHLYESVGNLRYETRWTHELTPPLEETSHTADVAYTIRGKDIAEIEKHARIALAFRFTPLLTFFETEQQSSSLEEIVRSLNLAVAKADAELGCPLKSVSFHGGIAENTKGYLEWEMIIDV